MVSMRRRGARRRYPLYCSQACSATLELSCISAARAPLAIRPPPHRTCTPRSMDLAAPYTW